MKGRDRRIVRWCGCLTLNWTGNKSNLWEDLWLTQLRLDCERIWLSASGGVVLSLIDNRRETEHNSTQSFDFPRRTKRLSLDLFLPFVSSINSLPFLQKLPFYLSFLTSLHGEDITNHHKATRADKTDVITLFKEWKESAQLLRLVVHHSIGQ